MTPAIPSADAASGPDAAAPCGSVSLLRLLELYGESHRAELEELWGAPGTDYLVLFADEAGGDLAILTVGPGHDYKRLDEAVACDIDGMHAICHTPALGAYRAGVATRAWKLEEADRALIAESCPEAAESLAQAIVAGRKAGLHPVRAALAHLALHMRDLVQRERYVAESENKLADRAHALTERLAELEQREAELAGKIAAHERRQKGESGRPFDRDLHAFSLPSSLRP